MRRVRSILRVLRAGRWVAGLWLGAVCATPAAAGSARDMGVVVTTHAAADSVTVGQRFHVTHKVTFPDSLRMLPFEAPKAGKTRFLSTRWKETRAKGTVTRTADLVGMTLSLEDATVPAMTFAFTTPAGDTVTSTTVALEIPVRAMAAAGDSLRPLKAQWEAPPSHLAWYLAAAAVLALAALVWWWWRWRRRRPEAAPAPVPRMPPDYVALAELSRIERMELVAKGEFKTYYTLVTDAVRRYLEERFGVTAMDRTTDELLGVLAAAGAETDGLGPLLQEADLVKFAKHTPAASNATAAMRAAREIVVRTSRPAPVETGAAAGEAGGG